RILALLYIPHGGASDVPQARPTVRSVQEAGPLAALSLRATPPRPFANRVRGLSKARDRRRELTFRQPAVADSRVLRIALGHGEEASRLEQHPALRGFRVPRGDGHVPVHRRPQSEPARRYDEVHDVAELLPELHHAVFATLSIDPVSAPDVSLHLAVFH